MDYKINNNESNDRDDWRFQGQDKYLTNAKLWFKQYKKPTKNWDHDHCSFCWATFSEYPEDLHYGYCTEDKTYWICQKCYNDFQKLFKWKLST